MNTRANIRRRRGARRSELAVLVAIAAAACGEATEGAEAARDAGGDAMSADGGGAGQSGSDGPDLDGSMPLADAAFESDASESQPEPDPLEPSPDDPDDEDDDDDDEDEDQDIVCATREIVSVGSAEDPEEVSITELPVTNESDPEVPSFFRITDLTPGVAYRVVAGPTDFDAGFEVFADDQTFTTSTCSGSRDDFCTVLASGSSVDVMLRAGLKRTGFELEVSPISETAEGTADAPLELPLGSLPAVGHAGAWIHPHGIPDARSHYRITGLSAGVTYALTVEALSSPSSGVIHVSVTSDWEGGDSGFDGAPLGFGAPRSLGFGSAEVLATPTADALLLRVDSSHGGTYAIDVRPASGTSEGEESAPQAITYPSSLPHAGHVGPGATSYYAVTGLPAGTYVVRLDPPDVASLGVYLEPAWNGTPTCRPSTQPGACEVSVSTGTLYVAVGSQGGDGTSFSLDVEPAPYETEGQGSVPLRVSRDALPRVSEVSAFANGLPSYYEIFGLTPGRPFVLTATGAEESLDLQVFSGASFAKRLCSASVGPSESESCEAVPRYSSIYVSAAAFGSMGTSFTLDVVPSPYDRPEGTLDERVEIACSEDPYVAHVSVLAPSYYALEGLREGASYVVTADSEGKRVTFSVFEDQSTKAVEDALCSIKTSQYAPIARCVIRAPASKVFATIEAREGATVEIKITEVPFESEGSEDDPIVLALGSLPYAGEVDATQRSVYRVTGLTPGAPYMATALSSDRTSVELSAPGTTSTHPGSAFGFIADESVDLQVSTVHASGGADFVLDVMPVPHRSEGTAEAPVLLAAGELPHAGTVDFTAPSVYRLTGLTEGLTYDLIADGASLVDLECSGGPGTSPQASFTATSTTFDFQVESHGWNDVSSAFELRLEPSARQVEGTAAAPHPLSVVDLPHEGRAVCSANNHYAIAGVTPGTRYVVKLGTPALRGGLLVYEDDTLTTTLCDDARIYFEPRCEIIAGSSTLHVAVDGQARTTDYSLDLEEVTYATEGAVDAPVALALDDLPHAGGVWRSGWSYYVVSGLSAGTPYEVTFADEEDALRMIVSDEASSCTASNLVLVSWGSYRRNPEPARCSFTPAGSTMSIAVTSAWPAFIMATAGTGFTLDVVAQ